MNLKKKLGLSITIFALLFVIGFVLLKPKIAGFIGQQKCNEAYTNVRRIIDGEISYFDESRRSSHGKHFLSAPLTPAGTPGPEKRKGNWEHPAWKALKFNPGPTYFSYQAEATKIDNEWMVTVRALGDIDGNGKIWELTRSAKTKNGEVPSGPELFTEGKKVCKE